MALKPATFRNVMMYINIKYIHITQSYSKTRKKMCVKTTLSVNLTDTVGKGLTLTDAIHCYFPKQR